MASKDRSITRPALTRPALLVGGSGQVGRELQPALSQIASVIAPTHAEVDLTRPDGLREIIRSVKPSLVINAAALTNVDRAEREPALAWQLNAQAPQIIAEESVRAGAVMVHFSTDYVFDGSQSTPYDETATPNPINRYGKSKLAGERAVAASGAPHLIVRTSWVYSRSGNGFVPTMLRQLESLDEVRVVADQVGSPTWSRSLAAATTELIRRLIIDDEVVLRSDDIGIYHLGGSGAASRLDIARELMLIRAEMNEPVRSHMVIPISSAEFGALAPRPRYSALMNSRASRRFGVELDDWKSELRRMLAS